VSYINLLIGYGRGLHESILSAARSFRKNEEAIGYADRLGRVNGELGRGKVTRVAERLNVGLTERAREGGDCNALTREGEEEQDSAS